ncbi:hypothetical protein HC931_02980 [Candidatus Gracilibacteria bacterium]|nr:hypothetical protein [Candidatus Gracilibacteria bacterium]NJM87197.1 hypothetical protein [Hydrococcus sp. RU_2_2]NJP20913.1 hypothetical protein [Hydrococcus sp. CRU_1_1]
MLQGPNFWVVFLYYFSGTTLIVLFVASQGMGMSLDMALPYQMGTLCGLISGIIGAYFNRSVIISLTFPNPKTLVLELDKALAQIGFEQKTQLDDYTIYSQSNTLRTVFSGKIFVKIENNCAQISGRSRYVKRLKDALS